MGSTNISIAPDISHWF